MATVNASALSDLTESLNDKPTVSMSEDRLTDLFPGTVRRRPAKVYNPDPAIDYQGGVLDILDGAGKIVFHHYWEKDYAKSDGACKFSTIDFHAFDIDSPSAANRKDGRFSFELEDHKMPGGKPNYRRVLFFVAHGTKPTPFADYFKEGETFALGGQGLKVTALVNGDGEPEGFVKIYESATGRYYFGNLKNGKLHGFVFEFGTANRSYVFRDVRVYREGKPIAVFDSMIKELRSYAARDDLTTISWS